MISDVERYKQEVYRLEGELAEMTAALSQAWDQLVPFLKEVPSQAETTQDIKPILHTVRAAADADLAGVYLFQADEWYCVPEPVRLSAGAIDNLAGLTSAETMALYTDNNECSWWALAPVLSEGERIGVLGIGTYDETHAFTAVDLRIIVRMAERIGHQITAAQLARLREKEMLQARDMQIASQIQQSVQPAQSPRTQSVQIASYWQPAREVGGDAWGWVQPHDDLLIWFILDVAGKGLPAALAAVALHTAISMALHMRLSPVEVLQAINTQFYDAYTRTDLFATVAIVSLNARTGALELANAGHPPVLVRHRGDWLRLPATAPPIGVLPTVDTEPQVIMLQPDDMVIIYSDGFTEVQTEGRLWGQTGLLGTITPEALTVDTIVQHIVRGSQRAGTINDDQTLVAAQFVNGQD